MKLDLGHPGPLGMDVKISGKAVFIGGSNHWLEWLHHITPGAGWREIRWAREVVAALEAHGVEFRAVAGHSLGGTVACIIATLYRGRGQNVLLYTYGAKRPPRGYYAKGKHIAIKGDVVPYLPPWRPKMPLVVLDYSELCGARESHEPRSYYEQMRKDGVR